MPQKDLRNCEIYITDGDSGSVEIRVGEGNLTWTERQTIEYTLNRGKLASADGGAARYGDDEPIDVTLDFLWDWYTSTGGVGPAEALKREGAASAWVSVDDEDPCAPYAVNIEVIYDAGECWDEVSTADGRYERYILPIFRYNDIEYNLDEGSISVTGQCQATKILTERVAVKPTPGSPLAE